MNQKVLSFKSMKSQFSNALLSAPITILSVEISKFESQKLLSLWALQSVFISGFLYSILLLILRPNQHGRWVSSTLEPSSAHCKGIPNNWSVGTVSTCASVSTWWTKYLFVSSSTIFWYEQSIQRFAGVKCVFCRFMTRQEWGGVNFEVGGAKFAIFALTYNVQFWSYEHVVNMLLVSFDLKKTPGNTFRTIWAPEIDFFFSRSCLMALSEAQVEIPAYSHADKWFSKGFENDQ